jgi:hypothetical protein
MSWATRLAGAGGHDGGADVQPRCSSGTTRVGVDRPDLRTDLLEQLGIGDVTIAGRTVTPGVAAGPRALGQLTEPLHS